MKLSTRSFIQALLLLPFAFSYPQASPRQAAGPGLYTLTAYAPNNTLYHGLKVEYSGTLNLFQEHTVGYCPGPPNVPNCPNGTEVVFSSVLYPSSEVPGGQEFYVASDGSTLITVQHSHFLPPGSYPYYTGWTWTPLPVSNSSKPCHSTCPSSDPLYNCDAPLGVFKFKAPDGPAEYEGGLRACPNLYDGTSTSVFAVTPSFNLTGCVVLEGLATHAYTGVNPPVWSYY